MFVKLTGRIYNYDSSNQQMYYEVRAWDKNYRGNWDTYEPCASYSTQVLTNEHTGGDSDKALECHAWGYDGVGAYLLACNILCYFAKGGNEEIARKYYKEFTTEVIANLPDTWEMTSGQINQWLESKQKQTKGKENERADTQTKGGETG